MEIKIKAEQSTSVQGTWRTSHAKLSTAPGTEGNISHTMEGYVKNDPGDTVTQQMENYDVTVPVVGLPAQAKGTRAHYSLAYKLSVVEWHKENGQSVSRTAKWFGVPNTSVRVWIHSEHKLSAANKDIEHAEMMKIRDRFPRTKALDGAVLEWYTSEVKAGKTCTTEDILATAKYVGDQLMGIIPFKGSDDCYRRWRKRNAVALAKLE
jgi:hypothetical protein